VGYAIGYGLCFGCRQPFHFNPVKVPSITFEGERQPICRACVERANRTRAEKGIPPFDIAPDAYDECDEAELA